MRRRAEVLLPASVTACVELGPSDCAKKPVLCSIENTVHISSSLQSVNHAEKKQRCIDPTPQSKPFDASFLFSQARSVLRQPPADACAAPIGREQQCQQLRDVMETFVAIGIGQSLYVSGLPGTGKSHTVRKVLQQVQSAEPEAAVVTWVNCMSVTSAKEVYNLIASAAAGFSNFSAAADSPPTFSSSLCSHRSASANGLDSNLILGHSSSPNCGQISTPAVSTYQQLLQKLQEGSDKIRRANSRPAAKAYKANRSSSRTAQQQQSRISQPVNSLDHQAADVEAHSPSSTSSATRSSRQKRRITTGSSTAVSALVSSSTKHIIVLDEVDNLVKKSQADLVQLYMLPHEPNLNVLLIGIANSIDLTERALPELKLKLVSPTLICFPAYTTQQLANILASCVCKLPTKVFEPSALELCARSVASSSGDLRHALKACRAALDELERQHSHQEKQQQQLAAAVASDWPAAVLPVSSLTGGASGSMSAPSATVPAVTPTVTVRYMMQALSRLASVRSSQFGAQATSTIRTLPNQQQLLLYALSVLCQPHSAVATDTSNVRDAGLWKAAGSATMLGSSNTSSRSSAAARLWTAGPAGDSPSRSVFVLAVGLEDAYSQYKQVCRVLGLSPCSCPELLHMAELLSQMALVDMIRQPTSGQSGSSSSPAMKALSGSSCRVSLGGGRGSRKGGLAGWGGLSCIASRKELFGGSGRSKGGVGVGGAAAAAQGVRLSLRASSEEVAAALRHNPALRCLVDK